MKICAISLYHLPGLEPDKSLQTELITKILVLLPCDESVVVYSELLK